MSTSEEHNHHWSKFIKKDPCFLTPIASSSVDEELVQFQRRLCLGLRGTRVLEIGCGDGCDAIGMIRQFDVASVVAIDVSEKRVNLAQDNVRRAGLTDRIQIRKMDAHKLAFPEHHFDVIAGNSICLFLDRERFCPEAVRVLKRGGRLMLFLESLAENPILVMCRRLDTEQRKRDVERLAKRFTLREIEEAGSHYFAGVEHKEFYLLFVVLRRLIISAAQRFLRLPIRHNVTSGTWSRALDRVLLGRFPFLRRYAWISVIQFTTPD